LYFDCDSQADSLYLFGLKLKMCNWCIFLEFGF
jgi:hypothetical protein